jgi:putative DNA-invertase from lambdoid prophage Rac
MRNQHGGEADARWRQAAALYCRASTADQTCARQERALRAFPRKACYKGCRGLEGNRLRGKAGARRTDPLGPLDARSVPHAADLQTWDVSLVAQTGWQFDLRSAQGQISRFPDDSAGGV